MNDAQHEEEILKQVSEKAARLLRAGLLKDIKREPSGRIVLLPVGSAVWIGFSTLEETLALLTGLSAGAAAEGELNRRGEQQRLGRMMEAIDPVRFQENKRLLRRADPASFPAAWDA